MRPDDEMLDGASLDGAPVDREPVDGDVEPLFLPDGHLSEGAAHAFVDGALGDEDAARVIAHVAGCPVCAGRVAEARGLAAAATRILGALDDVPVGVVPEGLAARVAAPAAAVASPDVPRDGAIRSITAARADRQARDGRRWTGWPVRAAASLVLAAGLGSAVWRSSREGRPVSGAADDVAFAPAAAEAPAFSLSQSAADTAAAASSATAAPSPAVAAAETAPAAAMTRPRLAEQRAMAGGTATAGAAAQRARSMQLAAADSVSVPAATPMFAPAPAPPAPMPPPPPTPPVTVVPAPTADAVASAAPAERTMTARAAARKRVAAPSDAATRDEVRRAGVPEAPTFEPPTAMMKAAPAVPTAAFAASPCVVLGGAPLVAGEPAPVRVRLDSLGVVVPASAGVTARWRVAGDSLRLVWRWVDAGTPARAELRLGAPDGDGVRRGTAQDAAGASAPASARPVRCDGGLR